MVCSACCEQALLSIKSTFANLYVSFKNSISAFLLPLSDARLFFDLSQRSCACFLTLRMKYLSPTSEFPLSVARDGSQFLLLFPQFFNGFFSLFLSSMDPPSLSLSVSLPTFLSFWFIKLKPTQTILCNFHYSLPL